MVTANFTKNTKKKNAFAQYGWMIRRRCAVNVRVQRIT